MGVVVLALFLLILAARSSSGISSDYHRHVYNVGDDVPLYVNKVGPLNNPSETYQYYELPFCQPDVVINKKESLGEVLNGDRLSNALYELKFRVERTNVVHCRKKLTRNDVAKFRNAVTRDFYFQMYYDDLPLWGFIGKIEDENWSLHGEGSKYFLFKHIQFNAHYNGNQIIEIHAFGDPNHLLDITEDVNLDVEFTYSVFWNETSTQFESRMNRYSRTSSLQIHRNIHWFSFINSIVIILLLVGLLAVIFMRHLKNDMRKSAVGDEEEDKEVGWKYIHGDVFRYPQDMPLFSAVLGSGTQLLTLVCFLFVLAYLGILYPYNSGVFATTLIIIYTLTSSIAGYTAASFYSQFAEAGWERSVLLTAMLFLGPFLLTAFVLNLLAVSYGATAALPFGTIIVIFLVYTILAIPLLALGGLIGYRCRSEFQMPSVTKRYPREIPTLGWYRKTPGQMFLAGLLPFSAIVLEMHQFYATVWGYKIFTLPGILFIMFIILIILTITLSVGLTYFQLTVEDHEWWWRSILRGGSTAIFMFAYSIYFYLKSNMSGFFQTALYFGYTTCICYAFFLMLGTISFHASFIFVRHIYRSLKSE